jgi:amino acid adenylation domain-containing protein
MNSTEPPLGPYGKSLAGTFRAAAAQVPDRVAVTGPDGELTYRALLDRVTRVGVALRAAGARTDTPVPVLVPTGIDLVTALVGAAMAGVPYAPVDPADPMARIRRLVGDAPVVLAHSDTAHLVPDITAVLVDDVPYTEELLPVPRETDLAYVVHTSGSTGEPKGVLVENHSVIRLFESTRQWFHFDANDVWTLFHAVTFDFSVWELWGALLHGGRLVVVPRDITRDPRRFRALVVDEGVTVLNQTPSAFRQFVELGAAPDKLRVVVLGGERLDVEMLRPWFARSGDQGPRVVNMYGITETTVHASYRPVTDADLVAPGVSPIGTPLPDLAFHVSDDGELYISGPGVARGYLGRDDLTAERFIDLDGVRAYRTGDRVRLLPDGGYEYLGRVDEQLNVRGHRVEPAEVEAVIGTHPDVVAVVAAATDHGDGDVRLVAHVVSRPEADWAALRVALVERAAAELPRHLRPSSFHPLDEVPLTRNGKIDRTALAAPAERGDSPESAVARIWSEVLAIDDADPDGDFFDQGGTSLSLLRLVARVEEHFGVSLDLSALLDGVTVTALTAAVGRAAPATKG